MRRFVPIALGLLLLALVLPGAAAAKVPTRGGVNHPISAPATDKITGDVAGTYNGTLHIDRFAVQNGHVVALGTVSGAVTDLAGNVGPTLTRDVALPVQNGASNAASPLALGTCDILSLVLGPLHLDLLGLVVDLNQVVLNITAESGAGNLLGNLLCAVAGLLDNSGPLTAIANLLNQILGILNGLTL
jgi:hypothetical protein